MKLPELRELFYKPGDKVRLTPWEWTKIIGMYYEALRQKMFEVWVEWYENQVYMECNYRNLKITWTLDRYNIEKWLIRDWKTTWNVQNAEYDIENTYDYISQMSFYYVLAYMTTGKECDVFLDIVSSSDPYNSMIYRLTAQKLRKKMQDTLKPALDALNQCHETNVRPSADRYTAMESDYYPIMEWSLIDQIVDSN